MPERSTIEVRTAEPYLVEVGREMLVPGLLDAVGDAAQVLIVHQPSLAAVADALKDALEGHARVLLAEVPDAEAAKRVEVAQFLWQLLGQADFTRSDCIVGLGGGAVTDLAGFVAATWLRGVPVIQVPTTVLGAVDAAVGGKTGINTEQGKNLVGAFHQPRRVITDLALFDTLPREELLTGMAEVVKCGFIADPAILTLLETAPEAVTDTHSPVFRELLERAIRVKADVVAEDTHEHGRREILNYGHTLGHAIEHAERYRWRHGAAISVGMVFAAELGRLVGRLDDDVVDRHRRILGALQLPLTYPLGRWSGLLATMRRDKKARGSLLRFVVLDDVAQPRILSGPDESMLFTAYQSLADVGD